MLLNLERNCMEQSKISDKIKQRRLQILVHSYIYYELDKNIVSDSKWAEWGKELVKLQNEYPEISSKVTLYEYFKDFDASSGAFLPLNLEWVAVIANRLLAINEKPKIPFKPQQKQTLKSKTKSLKLF